MGSGPFRRFEVLARWRAGQWSRRGLCTYNRREAREFMARAGRTARKAWQFAAFISYRHTEDDRKWAVWLHQALERYRLPRGVADDGDSPARLGRVFRDEEELPVSGATLGRDRGGAGRFRPVDRSLFIEHACVSLGKRGSRPFPGDARTDGDPRRLDRRRARIRDAYCSGRADLRGGRRHSGVRADHRCARCHTGRGAPGVGSKAAWCPA